MAGLALRKDEHFTWVDMVIKEARAPYLPGPRATPAED